METKEKNEFKIVGLSCETSVQECQKVLPDLWDKFNKRVAEIKNRTGDVVYGVSITKNIETCEFTYIAGIEVTDFEDIPEGMVQEIIPKEKYMVYEHKGHISKIGESYCKIMEEFKKECIKENKIWLEVYGKDYVHNSDDSKMGIWCSIE